MLKNVQKNQKNVYITVKIYEKLAKVSANVLFYENLLENFTGHLFKSFLDGVAIIKKHKANSHRQVLNSVAKVAHFLPFLVDVSVLDSFLNDKGCLIKVFGFETDS